MEDPLQYTKDEIIKNLILTETHLKQAVTGLDEQFCSECLDKHFYNLEALGDEGIGFTQDKNEINLFSEVAKTAKKFRGQDYKKHGTELAQKVREIRKSLTEECVSCKIQSNKNITKALNNPETSIILADENHTINSDAELNQIENKMKIDYKPLMYMNAGQFAAEGIRYAVETYKPTWDKYVTIGGGLVLQVVPMFVKLPPVIKQISMVAGSNLFANGVVKMVKGAVTPTVARTVAVNANQGQGVGGFAGKPYSYAPTFGGPTFKGKVTATNIPTQYTRAGILGGAQAFEAPEHADLIRVD